MTPRAVLAALAAWLVGIELLATPARLAIRRVRKHHGPAAEPQIRELAALQHAARRNPPARWAYRERIRALEATLRPTERRRRVLPVLARIALSIALCALTLSFAVLFTNTRPPRFGSPMTPHQLGMDYSELEIMTDDGVRLAAWHIPGDDGAPVVILLHGLGTARADMLGAAAALHEAGFHCLLPDFRAHGDSGGAFTSFGHLERRDAEAAYAAAGRLPGADGSRLGVYGFSMGGSVALMTAGGRAGVGAVVAEAPYDTLARAVGHYGRLLYRLPPKAGAPLFWLPYAAMFRTKLGDVAPVNRIGAIEASVMLVGSDDDPLVAPGTLGNLAGAAPGAVIYNAPGMGHMTEEISAGYFDRIVEFFEKAFGEEPQHP